MMQMSLDPKSEKIATPVYEPVPAKFGKAAIIGFGQIGRSVCEGLRLCGKFGQISAADPSSHHRTVALELGLVDEIFESPRAAVPDADLVVLCVPIACFGDVAREIGPFLDAGAIVTDVGSLKASVIEDIETHLPGSVEFVPAHPMAGTEGSGPESGSAELFNGAPCILTPLDSTSPQALAVVEALWLDFGCKVKILSPQHHDRIIATVSHIPHVIAFAIAGICDDIRSATGEDILDYAGPSFRGLLRVGASDPGMWCEIFDRNANNLADVGGLMSERISLLHEAIGRRDRSRIEKTLRKANAFLKSRKIQ